MPSAMVSILGIDLPASAGPIFRPIAAFWVANAVVLFIVFQLQNPSGGARFSFKVGHRDSFCEDTGSWASIAAKISGGRSWMLIANSSGNRLGSVQPRRALPDISIAVARS